MKCQNSTALTNLPKVAEISIEIFLHLMQIFTPKSSTIDARICMSLREHKLLHTL